MPGADMSPLQKVLLIAALAALGYLLLQSGGGRPVVSGWRPPSAAQPKAIGISGSSEQQARGGAPDDPAAPYGNPLQSDRTVMTQGYGVGSHAPAAVWGGVDLALDGDGDGKADPQGTWNAPIFATHDGVARVRPDTWPAGNYLAIDSGSYKTAYAHLAQYAVRDGEQVKRGQLVGYVGSTGQSIGPHLHYEVWKDGANVNPLDYGALER